MITRTRQRLARAANDYLLEDEILQNVVPATRGLHPLTPLTAGAGAASLASLHCSLLGSIAIGAGVVALVAFLLMRPALVLATDHALVVLDASWFDFRPRGIDARLPRRSRFAVRPGLFAVSRLDTEQYWIPSAWVSEAEQADDAWSAVRRVPAVTPR